MKATLIRISTQEIIKKAEYPKNVIEPIIGLDPDLKWLLVNEVARPPYDPSVEKLIRVEQITIEAHPVYPDFDQYKIYWNIVALTAQEQSDYQQRQDDADGYGTKQSIRQADGQIMVNRFFAVVHRRVGNGTLTPARAVKVSNYMKDGLWFLSNGEMELAKNSFNTIDLSGETAANQTAIQEIIDLGISKIDDYVASE